jgi:hypothetical protein
MDWYKKLPVPRSKADRLRETQRYAGGSKEPITIRAEKMCFYKGYSKPLYIQGYKVKVCSRYHIAKFFGVPLSTILNWEKHNVLPEPFLYQEGPRGSYPVFLSAQLRVLLMVVRDLAAEGYVSIPWSRLPAHIQMLHEGYETARNAYYRRAVHQPYDGDGDRFGVVILD